MSDSSLRKETLCAKKDAIIDGHTGFLFLDKNDIPLMALHWEKYMEHTVAKYNKTYRVQLPKITPHVCFEKGANTRT